MLEDIDLHDLQSFQPLPMGLLPTHPAPSPPPLSSPSSLLPFPSSFVASNLLPRPRPRPPHLKTFQVLLWGIRASILSIHLDRQVRKQPDRCSLPFQMSVVLRIHKVQPHPRPDLDLPRHNTLTLLPRSLLAPSVLSDPASLPLLLHLLPPCCLLRSLLPFSSLPEAQTCG